MDDLVNLIIIGLVALFALMSSKKKKRPPTTPPPRRAVREQRPTPQVRPRAVSAEVPDREPVASPPARAKTPEPDRPRDLAEELMLFLQGRVPAPKPPERAVARPEELPEPEEARSLETLEEAGTTTHARFHKLYTEAAPELEVPPGRGKYTRARLELSGQSLKDAFVMKEVLGPPKGME